MDFSVHLHPLPGSVRGFITERDGESIIVVNSLLSFEEQMKAFRHELLHLLRQDLHREEDVGSIEAGVSSSSCKSSTY